MNTRENIVAAWHEWLAATDALHAAAKPVVNQRDKEWLMAVNRQHAASDAVRQLAFDAARLLADGDA